MNVCAQCYLLTGIREILLYLTWRPSSKRPAVYLAKLLLPAASSRALLSEWKLLLCYRLRQHRYAH